MNLLHLALIYCWAAPAALVVAGWLSRRALLRAGRPRAWLLVWWLGSVALVGPFLLIHQLTWFVETKVPSQPGSGFETAGAGLHHMALVVALVVGWAGVGLHAMLWACLFPRPPWNLRWTDAVAGTLLVGALAALCLGFYRYGPAGVRTPVYWDRHGFAVKMKSGQVVEIGCLWPKWPTYWHYREGLQRLVPGEHSIEGAEFISVTDLTDDDLRYLARLPKLRKLSLSSCRRITDAGIEHLRGHPSLEELDLGGTAVTDACIPALLSMPRLRLVSTNATNNGGTMTMHGDAALAKELKRRQRVGP